MNGFNSEVSFGCSGLPLGDLQLRSVLRHAQRANPAQALYHQYYYASAACGTEGQLRIPNYALLLPFAGMIFGLAARRKPIAAQVACL